MEWRVCFMLCRMRLAAFCILVTAIALGRREDKVVFKEIRWEAMESINVTRIGTNGGLL